MNRKACGRSQMSSERHNGTLTYSRGVVAIVKRALKCKNTENEHRSDV
jgi:hypothetical protein